MNPLLLSLLTVAAALAAPARASDSLALGQARAALAGPTAAFDGGQERASVDSRPDRSGVAVATTTAEAEARIDRDLSGGLSSSIGADIPLGEDKPRPVAKPSSWLGAPVTEALKGAVIGIAYGAFFGGFLGALIGAAIGFVLTYGMYRFLPSK